MIETLILEDEPHLQEQILTCIRKFPNFHISGICDTVQEAIHAIDTLKPQMIICDIQLLDGYAFEALEKAEHKTYKLIFVTAYDHFAIQALKLGAIDYLLKPINRNELYEAIQRAREMALTERDIAFLRSVSGQHDMTLLPLTIRTTQETYILQQEDIVYCKAEGSYTYIFTAEEKTIMASKNIREYEHLLSPKLFLRPHQSYLVNRNFIKSIQKGNFLQLTLLKEPIPISSRKKGIIFHMLQNTLS